jgi:nitroimidazol reductase NimA-like FMN-containing flavoprotein (pyridoxamine 5'-phosphate oxidase superfamily)
MNMRRSDKEITDKVLLNEILTTAQICRVAFFADDYPYIVPMNFGYSNGYLYFHGAPEGRKLDLIKKNNKVGFEIELAHEIIKDEVSCKWTTKYRSIIGTGEMEIVTDTEEKIAGLDCIMAQHGKTDNAYNSSAVNYIVVLKLRINSMAGKQSRYVTGKQDIKKPSL